ncbi:MAG: hypothetical protein FJY77_03725 [Candidatus Altiarchaeales archaeon]|nr:hypothetical protein [Candidatus Altiarchaeales archaeon]
MASNREHGPKKHGKHSQPEELHPQKALLSGPEAHDMRLMGPRVEVLGHPLLELKEDGSPVNYKPCLFLPCDLLPVAILSSTPDAHPKGVRQALPAIQKVRELPEAAGKGMKTDDLMNRLLLYHYVPLIVVGRGKDARVVIRPDYHFYFNYRRAVGILSSHPLNIPPEKIKFMVMEPERREILKCMGCMHMIDALSNEEDLMLDAIKESQRCFESGNRFFSSERVSYMSVQHLADVLSDIDDRQKFQHRLDEIIHKYQEPPPKRHLREGEVLNRQLDFLLVDRNGVLNPDTGFIFEGLQAVAEEARGAHAWDDKAKGVVQTRFGVVLHNFSSKNNPNFNRIDLNNMPPEVRNTLYYVVKNVRTEADFLKLESEFRGIIKPLPGGYIVGREEEKEVEREGKKQKEMVYTSGVVVEVSKLPDRTREVLRRKQVESPEAEYVVIKPGEVQNELESVQTFQVKNVPEGSAVRRYWIFDSECSATMKGLLNGLLATHPNLRYGYFCSVPESRSKRDKLAADTRLFGEPDREVHIPVYMHEGDREVKILDRRLKWDPLFWVEKRGLSLEKAVARGKEYVYNLMDRVACIQKLCPGAGLPAVEVYSTYEHVPNVGSVPKLYGVREYIDGPATNRISLDSYSRLRTVESILACKGGIAAANCVIGRRLSDDGDEIVSRRDKNGVPVELRLADPTTSFRNVDTPMKDDAGLYACHIACDLVKCYLSTAWWNRPILGTIGIASSFYKAFAREFKAIQQNYRNHRGEFDRFMEERIKKDIGEAREKHDSTGERVRQNPEFSEWNMRSRWTKALERLDSSDAKEIVTAIRSATEKMWEADFYVIKGLSASEQIQALELFTRTVAMNHQNFQHVLDVVTGDKEFQTQGFEGRMQRINAMRISSWINAVGCNPSEVIGFAMDYVKAGTAEADRNSFTGKANERFENLHLSKEMGETLFDLATNLALVGELDGKGYILKPSYTA